MKFTAIQQQQEENKSTALQNDVGLGTNKIEVVKKHGVINMNPHHQQACQNSLKMAQDVSKMTFLQELEKEDPVCFEYLHRALNEELEECTARLAKLNAQKDVNSDRETRESIRTIWVLEGTLYLNQEHQHLTNLAEEYEKNDSVPNGYD